MELSELIENLEEEVNEQLETIFDGDPIQPTSISLDANLTTNTVSINVYIFIESGEHRIVDGERVFFPPDTWDEDRIKDKIISAFTEFLHVINQNYEAKIHVEPYPEQGN